MVMENEKEVAEETSVPITKKPEPVIEDPADVNVCDSCQ